MTSPPPAAPHGQPAGQPALPGGVTRIVRTNELPPGVDALASGDGKTIIVRASLDRASRRRAIREVMATIRRFPRLALVPAVSLDAIRQLVRRVVGAVYSIGESLQQLVGTAAEHVSGLAVAVTAAAGTAAVVTVVVATASPNSDAGAGHRPGDGGARPAAAAGGHRAVHASLPATPLSYLGVYEDGVPGSFSGVAQFGLSVGAAPNIALYYSSWNEQFSSSFAEQAYAEGITAAVQMEPFGVSISGIASGDSDGYLESFASQVRDFGHAVIIGFGHEPDGSWYPWGAGRVSPGTWIAAWRHVVDVFRAEGADNVIWLWTVNSQGPEAATAEAWWPGSAYVTWIGLDGYYARPGETFESIFDTILDVVQGLGKPIIISETAVGPGTGNQVAGIANLFAGLRANRLLGLIWFDQAQDSGPYRQDWRLEGHPALVQAFRAAAGYLSS
jgi:mannan endo-1,4-beta-mannosidase